MCFAENSSQNEADNLAIKSLILTLQQHKKMFSMVYTNLDQTDFSVPYPSQIYSENYYLCPVKHEIPVLNIPALKSSPSCLESTLGAFQCLHSLSMLCTGVFFPKHLHIWITWLQSELTLPVKKDNDVLGGCSATPRAI